MQIQDLRQLTNKILTVRVAVKVVMKVGVTMMKRINSRMGIQLLELLKFNILIKQINNFKDRIQR